MSDVSALIAKAVAGDGLAFMGLVDPLSPRLIMVIRRRGGRVLGPDCGAEDLLQVVLATAWRLMPKFVPQRPQGFYNWLLTLTDRAISDRVKYVEAKGRGGVRHLESVAGGTPSSPQNPQPYDSRTSVTKVVARRAEIERLDQLLSGLDSMYREVVERHLLESKSLSTIGKELGLSKNAAWNRLRKGMRQLREGMGVTS